MDDANKWVWSYSTRQLHMWLDRGSHLIAQATDAGYLRWNLVISKDGLIVYQRKGFRAKRSRVEAVLLGVWATLQ